MSNSFLFFIGIEILIISFLSWLALVNYGITVLFDCRYYIHIILYR